MDMDDRMLYEPWIVEAVKKPPEEALSGWSWIPLDRHRDQGGGNNLASVYLCLRNCLDSPRSDLGRNKWYKIDFKEEEEEEEEDNEDENNSNNSGGKGKWKGKGKGKIIIPTEPVCCALDKMPNGAPDYSSSSLVLGSRIYVIGGRSTYPWFSFDNLVYYFDTNLPDQGWRQGPQMLAGRCGPSAVAIDGKIYIFGGTRDWLDPTKPYAEVLDPDLDQWVALPSPPPHLLQRFTAVPPVNALLLDARGHKHIVFLSVAHSALYSYDLDARTWSPFDTHFGYSWFDLAAAVDGVLYCCHRCYVYGYDLLNRRRFSQPVKGLIHDVLPPRVCPVHLLHIGGGKLFLFWTSGNPFQRPGDLAIYCTVFTVDKSSPEPGSGVDDEPVLSAHVHSVSRLVAHGEDRVVSCFAF